MDIWNYRIVSYNLVVAPSTIKQWLDQHYLDWQRDHGTAPEKAFAEWLGVNPKTYNHWSNGRRKPGPDDCDILAYKLRDLSCYSLLGYPTPDPLLLQVKMEWDSLSDETQAAIGDILKGAEDESKSGDKPISRLSPSS